MKKIIFLSALIIVSITSFGEDIELYISEADNEASVRPAWAAFFIGLFSYAAFRVNIFG